MKPQKLILSAFGSYAEEAVIDFTHMDGGIFLITGDTGAGKTTLFDGITYALYNETSGGVRDGDMMRSQYAKEAAPTFVELTFLHRGKSYKIRRNPNYMRISKRKNKNGEYAKTKESAKVELTLSDGKVYPGNQKQTNQKIIEIVGLSLEQFTQISMIAQGQFLKLLLASSKERKKIFSQIFQTKIYAYIQERLGEEDKKLYLARKDNQIRWEEQEKNLRISNSFYQKVMEKEEEEDKNPIPISDISSYYTPQCSSLREKEELLSLTEQWIGTLKEEEKSYTKEISEYQKELDQLLLQMEQEKGRQKLVKEQDKMKMQLDVLSEKNSLIEDRRNALFWAKKAEQAAAKELLCISIKEKEERLQTEQEELAKRLKKLSEEEKQAETDWKSQKERCDRELPENQRQFLKLQEELSVYEAQKKEQQELIRLEREQKTLEQNQEKLFKTLQNQETEKERLTKLIEDGNTIPLLLEKEEKTAVSLEERLRNLHSLLEGKKVLIDVGKRILQAQEQADRAILRWEGEEASYQKLSSLFLKNQAGILAGSLEPGKPCPVCGSTVHPSAAVLSKEAKEHGISEERVRKAREKVEAAREKASQASEQASKVMEERKLQIARYEEKGLALFSDFSCEEKDWEKAKEEYILTRGQLLESRERVEKLKAQEEKRKEYALQAEKLSEDIQKGQIRLEQQKNQLDEFAGKIQTRKALWQTRQEGLTYGSYQEAQKSYQEIHTLIREMEERLETARTSLEEKRNRHLQIAGVLEGKSQEAARLQKEKVQAGEQYEAALLAAGFETEEDYRSKKASLSMQNSWEKEIKEYENQSLSLSSRLEQNQKQLEKAVERDLELLEEHKSRLEAERKKKEKDYREIYNLLAGSREAEGKLKKIYEAALETEQAYELIHPLYETASGRLTGSAKLDFQTYMQRRYFKRIIEAANKRLAPMSRDEFTLACRDLSDLSIQGEAGLDLNVYSLATGTIRDVKTLSGGESFLAALSMALGLGDIIQQEAGKIEVDTLFIDEGFGSLDEESRRQAMEVLVSLTEGNRLVGIISHVSELREQIDRKLVITKGQNGSTVKWVD